MAELRRDPIVGRWVIVDTDHPAEPSSYEYEPRTVKGGSSCPFCYGNEGLTPPEIESIREAGTGPNTSGWGVRVVPNKFPALKIEGELDRRGLGIYDLSNGIGAHEVLVETPYHHKDLHELLNEEIEKILNMYCRRSQDLIKDRRFKYILIFKNSGASAGASLEHPHTQLIALPMVPKNAVEELKGCQRYFEYRERCLFCDIIRQETEEGERIILENEKFLAFCPFASRFPFEIWIIPKKHQSYFYDSGPDDIRLLASILKDTIAKVKALFKDLPYNFIIHSTPMEGEIGNVESYHWHIEFMPKLTRVAGFEWGTGFYVVPTPPELAAQYLKSVKV